MVKWKLPADIYKASDSDVIRPLRGTGARRNSAGVQPASSKILRNKTFVIRIGMSDKRKKLGKDFSPIWQFLTSIQI